VVYEDQGPPFWLREGDCVLQPPRIRHRVIECSPGLEVIEVGCPANHETWADHDLELPTGRVLPERDFGGQRFVHHVASTARWQPWRLEGFEARDTGIAAATSGLATVRVVRSIEPLALQEQHTNTEFLFLFVLSGAVALHCDGRDPVGLKTGDSCVLPEGLRHGWKDCSSDFEMLEVALPAAFSQSSD
jgi:mannose-6-phosphate isomerase-like protein (cupin superfamily)